MQSSLGFYVDKNMIKYAKVNVDEKTNVFTLAEHGIKFYDNIIASITDIVDSTSSIDSTKISLSMANEGYHSIEVFSGLKAKDRNDLIQSEFAAFCEGKGMAIAAMENRYQMVENTGNFDKLIALISYVSQSELANININFDGYKISSIAPIGLSINNIFRNKGIDEEAAIVNIENKTTVTIILRNEIQEVVDIPLGMTDVLDKLAEKYNSYSKAYEACKKVSVYIDDVTSIDEESREILDAVLPIFYDIRQRVDEILTPYKRLIKAVYISGGATAVNNVDLYFQESFPGLRCEIAKPFFLSQQQRTDAAEIVEVNSAIAIAMNGLGLLEPSIDFHTAAKKAMKKPSAVKEKLGSLKISEKIKRFKEGMKEKADEVKANHSKAKRARRVGGAASPFTAFIEKIKGLFGKKGKKRNVVYDEGSYAVGQSGGEGEEEEDAPVNGWVIGMFATCLIILATYFAGALYVSQKLRSKIQESNRTIATIEGEIERASGDAAFIRTQTAEYDEKIDKLQRVMATIAAYKMKSSFDIPNFMSEVMFIIPQGVEISTINISEQGEVDITASSTQYAQLGYFVARLKLENVLKNVDMEVQSMSSDIKIKIGGVLP